VIYKTGVTETLIAITWPYHRRNCHLGATSIPNMCFAPFYFRRRIFLMHLETNDIRAARQRAVKTNGLLHKHCTLFLLWLSTEICDHRTE